ncbi:MAG: hypothetical protein JKY60_19250, partial [Kordiimonadaceae bacterium]|nr:hypothetical protein [Kordiimonadaceae bacterium]
FVPFNALAFKWGAYGKMPYFRSLVFTTYCSVSASIWLTVPQHLVAQVMLGHPLLTTVINLITVGSALLTVVFFFFGYKNLQQRSGMSSFLRTLLAVFWTAVVMLIAFVAATALVVGYLYLTDGLQS